MKDLMKNPVRELRQNSSDAEQRLWYFLRAKRLGGYKFRRQYSVGRYVVDFYCPAIKLAIEIDGDSHFIEDAPEYDEARQKFIESYGIKFLRFTNTEVSRNLQKVLEKILISCKKYENKF